MIVAAVNPPSMSVAIASDSPDRQVFLTLEMAAASSSGHRIDVVGARTTTFGALHFTIVHGAPSPSRETPPQVPVLPERFLPMAQVFIPCSVSVIHDAQIIPWWLA